MKKLAILVAMALWPISARADFEAAKLQEYCQAFTIKKDKILTPDSDRMEAGSCVGYMLGSLQFILDLQGVAANNNLTSPFCVPPDADGEQIRRAYLMHIGKHPEKIRWHAASVLNDAMVDAFPCPAKP